ncbi:hypothetical protein cypCar_00028082, partial [Cyprinus carpio]
EFVVVDEHGGVDETKVVYLEPQKLIVKENTDEKIKEVTYRKDCLGHAFTTRCNDPCPALDPPRTTAPYNNTTEETGRNHVIMYIIGVIIIFIIAVTVICLRRKCQS